MGCGVTYSTTTEQLQNILCGMNVLPPMQSDPSYGTIKWVWGRAGGRCPTLDPEARIPAWSFYPGRYSSIRKDGRTISAKDYMIRKSLIDHCGSSSGGPVIIPPPPLIGETWTPTMAAPDPYVPPIAMNPDPPIPVERTPTIPAPQAVPVSTRTTMTTFNSPIQFGGSGPGPVSSTQPWIPTGGSGSFWDPIISGAGEWVSRQVFGGTTKPGAQDPGYTTPGITGGCPTGYKWNGQECVAEGVQGWIQRTIPGGQSGVYEGPGGSGLLPGAEPPQFVNRVTALCPTGFVLGRDGACYDRRVIPNKLRKYPRGRRPLLTGGEMKTLSRAKALEGKVKRAWTAAGKPGQTRCRRK